MRPPDAQSLADEFRRRGLRSIAMLIETMESSPIDGEAVLCICSCDCYLGVASVRDPYEFFINLLTRMENGCEYSHATARTFEQACHEVVKCFNEPGRMTIH